MIIVESGFSARQKPDLPMINEWGVGVHRGPRRPQGRGGRRQRAPCAPTLIDMRRPKPLPPALADAPFTLAAALQHGVDGERLRTAEVDHPYRGVYVPQVLPDSFDVRCAAADLALPSRAVLSHLAAAAWYGCPLPVGTLTPVAVEVTVPAGTVLPQTLGIQAHVARLDPDDVRVHRGRAVTSPARTALDLAAVLPLEDVVAIMDYLLAQGLASREALQAMVDGAARRRGVRRARRALELAEPRTRSSMETRVRLHLVLAGLPWPECNADVFDADGEWLATVDFLYREQRLIIEYDGRHHGDERQRVIDLHRRNLLTREGYVVLHFTARDVFLRPDQLVAQVREALARAVSAAA